MLTLARSESGLLASGRLMVGGITLIAGLSGTQPQTGGRARVGFGAAPDGDGHSSMMAALSPAMRLDARFRMQATISVRAGIVTGHGLDRATRWHDNPFRARRP